MWRGQSNSGSRLRLCAKKVVFIPYASNPRTKRARANCAMRSGSMKLNVIARVEDVEH